MRNLCSSLGTSSAAVNQEVVRVFQMKSARAVFVLIRLPHYSLGGIGFVLTQRLEEPPARQHRPFVELDCCPAGRFAGPLLKLISSPRNSTRCPFTTVAALSGRSLIVPTGRSPSSTISRIFISRARPDLAGAGGTSTSGASASLMRSVVVDVSESQSGLAMKAYPWIENSSAPIAAARRGLRPR